MPLLLVGTVLAVYEEPTLAALVFATKVSDTSSLN